MARSYTRIMAGRCAKLLILRLVRILARDRDLEDLDTIVNQGPAHGVTFPCETTIQQGMQIECNANLWFNYRTDEITIDVDEDHTVLACRANVCSQWASFTYQIGDKSKTEWVRIFRFDSGGPPRSSPHSVSTVEEAR